MKVSLVHCDDYDPARVREAVGRAVGLIGGWGRFLPSGGRVVIKPNLLMAGSDRRPITTHPEVVRAVFEAVRAEGCDAAVFDHPSFGTARSVAKAMGLADLPLVDSPGTVRWKPALGAFGEIERFDLGGAAVVNVAKYKTHGMMGLSLATKNLFGLIRLAHRVEWHLKAGVRYDHFAGLLVEIERHARPALNLLDAVVAMEGNGPSSGTPRKIGCVMACPDALSLDAVACRLVGWPPPKLKVLDAARRMGVEFDWDPDVAGDRLADHCVRDFRFASDPDADPATALSMPGPKFVREWVRRWSVNRPVLKRSACEGCGRCVSVCPVKAIALQDGTPAFRLDGCIRCFCCQEICPEGAISVKRGLLSWWASRGR